MSPSILVKRPMQGFMISSKEYLGFRGPSCTTLGRVLEQNELSLLTSETKGKDPVGSTLYSVGLALRSPIGRMYVNPVEGSPLSH
jgi:hypothetical protein